MKYGNYRFNTSEDAEYFYESMVTGGAIYHSRVVMPYKERDGIIEVNPFWKDAKFELKIVEVE